MTNERIAGTAATGQLAVVIFLLVPNAAALGLALSLALMVASSVIVGLVAHIAIRLFSQDDPWRDVVSDSLWDMELHDLSA